MSKTEFSTEPSTPRALPSVLHLSGRDWTKTGQGIRFAVYSNGNEVVKRLLSPAQLLEDWFQAGHRSKTLDEASDFYRMNLSSILGVRHRLIHGLLPAALFGQPMIDTNGCISQKRLTPLWSVLQTSSAHVIRGYINAAVNCSHTLVRCGALGLYFAIPVDYALDEHNEIVIMGFGGIEFDRQRALDGLRDKPWRTAIAGIHMLPRSVQDYFIERFETGFTEDSVSREWAQDLAPTATG